MAAIQSKASGNWSDGSTWDSDPAIPVNGDTVTILNTHTVLFDVDMTGWANGITLTVDAGGTLIWTTANGTYLLMTSADIILKGTLQWGTDTDTPLPFTSKATIDFNETSSTIRCGGTAVVKLYVTQPTTRWVKLDEGEPVAETVLSVDTDVTGDIWVDGDEIAIVNIDGGSDYEIRTIDTGGIAAGAITVTAGLAKAKMSGAYVVLLTRHGRIIDTTDHIIANSAIPGNYVSAELDTSTRTFDNCAGFEFAGVAHSMTSQSFYSGNDNVMSGVIIDGEALYEQNPTVSGFWAGGSYSYSFSNGGQLTTTGIFAGMSYGITSAGAWKLYGIIDGCNDGIRNCIDIVGSLELNNNINDIGDLPSYNCRFYNTLFGGSTEYQEYNSIGQGSSNYTESFDHDQVVNAFKAWCRGGIVTSQTTSPPSGYNIWYEHACESATYPCFRQFQATVLPGTALEVKGKIRIADGEDLSVNPPALQIIDYFADPLVDPTQSPLDEDKIPKPDGGEESGWQDVSVIWANQGDAPRTVLVRMIAYHATADVDEVWSICEYKEQIATIYEKIKRLSSTSQT